MENITLGTLLTNKKGKMFTVYDIKKYTYCGQEKTKYRCYEITDNGLIIKTKIYSYNIDEIGQKCTVLNWRF